MVCLVFDGRGILVDISQDMAHAFRVVTASSNAGDGPMVMQVYQDSDFGIKEEPC